MNLRNVLRAYSLLRQLSDDESALLNILRTLNDSDREALVVSMSDKPQKKAGKKAAGGGGKSKRASGMAAQLNRTLQGQRKATDDSDDDNRFDGKSAQDAREDFLSDARCAKEGCGWMQGDLIHQKDGGYAGYHEFVAPPATHAATGATGD